jgi:autotransporter translocation and assembly factor TamB
VKTFFRITYYTGIILVFVFIALLGFTQTKTFRAALHSYLLEKSSTVLNGSLRFGPIEGNLLTGAELDSVLVVEGTTPVASIKRLEVRYDALGLLTGKVLITRLRLVEPEISLMRSVQGDWNVERLIKPSEPDSASAGWIVDIKNLQIENAAITVVDSFGIMQRESDASFSISQDVIDYRNIRLKTVNLEASARIEPSSLSLEIRRMGAQSEHPWFSLASLTGHLYHSPTETKVTRLAIRTAGSTVRISAHMNQVNPLEISDLRRLEKVPVTVDLEAPRIDFHELRQFIYPWIDFLEKDASLRVKASGLFGRLNIESLQLQTPKSILRADGTIINLHRPKDLELHVLVSQSRINPEDILARIPGLSIPDMGLSSDVDFSLHFRGRPDLFTVNAEATVDSGKVVVEASLNHQQQPMNYEVNVQTHRFDPGALFADERLNGALSMNASFRGTGTDLSTARGLLRADIDSSEIWGISIAPSNLVAELGRQALLSRLSLNTNAGQVEATSAFRFYSDSTTYDVRGKAVGMDLRRLAKSARYESGLSFDFVFASSRSGPDQSSSHAIVSFQPSRYRSYEFEEGKLEVRLNQRGDKNTLDVRSPIADLSIEGSFSPASVVAYVESGVRILGRAISHRIASLDSVQFIRSTKSQSPGRPLVVQFADAQETIDASFNLRIHSLYPIGVFAGVELGGALTWNGTIAGTVNDLKTTGDATIDWFQYRDDNTLLTAFNGKLRHDLRGIDRVNPLDSLAASLEVQVGRMNLNETLLTDTRVIIESPGDTNRFEIATTIDSLARVALQGASRLSGGSYQLSLPVVRVAFPQTVFESQDAAVALAGADGLRIDRLILRHEVEEIDIAGFVNPLGKSNLQIQVRDFLLTHLSQFSRDEAYNSAVKDLAGILNATFRFQGTFQDPSMFLGLQAGGFRSRQTVFGSLNANLSYSEQLLRLSVELRSMAEERAGTPELVLAGSLPYDLRLSGASEGALAGDMDLVLRSRGLNLDVLDPFVAELANISGTMIADVRIRGNTQDPSYNGYVAFQNARFLLVPLGISYIVNGRLVPQGRNVALENVTIRNTEQDRPDGLVRARGTFSLKGLAFKDFDFFVNGQLLVMKETARRPDQSFYGNLFVATSSGGLRWQGTPDRSVVIGEVLVRNGSMTFPPTRGSFVLPNRAVTVTFVNDTAKSLSDLHSRGDLLAANVPASFNGQGTPPASTSNVGGPAAVVNRSFLENIVFDLTIETQGLTQVRFVFNPLTGEELFADLQGRLVFAKSEEQTRLTGEVNVTSRSYYSFIQKFEASGKLLFTGDPVNPELNVTARYEGIYTPPEQTLSDTLGVTRAGEAPSIQHPVTVVLEITGTRSEPKVKIGLDVKDEQLKQKIEADVESNAIAFLINGTFRDELTQQQRTSLLGGNILMGLTSSVLSGPLTDFLRREFGVIRSVDVLFYGGGSFQEIPDVRVTGEVGDAVIRFGGRVFSGLDNANVNIQFPLSSMLGSDRWRNLVLELERRDEFVETVAERRKSNSARLVYRISF